MLEAQQKAYKDVVRKLDRYIEMRANDEISEEEYRTRRDAAMREKERVNAYLKGTDDRVNDWVGNMESAFEFIAYAKSRFNSGSEDSRRCIFVALGSNRQLKDRLVLLNMEETLLPMKKLAKEVRDIHEMLEPQKHRLTQSDYEKVYDQSPIVSARLDSNQRPFA